MAEQRWPTVFHLTQSACLVALLTGPMPATAAERCDTAIEATDFGQWIPIRSSKSTELREEGRTVLSSETGTQRYMRVMFELLDPGEPGWALIIRDNDGRVLQALGEADFARLKVVMSGRLSTNAANLFLEAPGERPIIELRQKVEMPEEGYYGEPYYSIQGSVPAWIPLYTSTDIADRWLGDNVGMLMVGVREGYTPGSCTGIALPPNLLLTNWHCGPVTNMNNESVPGSYWNPAICDRTVIDLSWDDDAISREFVCEKVVAKSEGLDYALLRIHPLEDFGVIPPVEFDLSRGSTTATLVHHPQSAKKQISTSCQVEGSFAKGGVAYAAFYHKCDTEHGSSGAPIFNAAGQLMGLHFSGFEKLTNGKCDMLNKGIWIDEIFRDLLDLSPDRPLTESDITAELERLSTDG